MDVEGKSRPPPLQTDVKEASMSPPSSAVSAEGEFKEANIQSMRSTESTTVAEGEAIFMTKFNLRKRKEAEVVDRQTGDESLVVLLRRLTMLTMCLKAWTRSD